MPRSMAIPVAVTLDRADLPPIDLTPMLEPGTLSWSSVVPGGFGSSSFQVNGDFRWIAKQLPHLTVLRITGDSGKILFEGQLEDSSPSLSSDSTGAKLTAFGFQNVLQEKKLRYIWSKRDMSWASPCLTPYGTAFGGFKPNPNIQVTTGQFDPTDLSKSGVQIAASNGGLIAASSGNYADWQVPGGLALSSLSATLTMSGTDAGSTKWEAQLWQLVGSTWTKLTSSTASGTASLSGTFSGSPSIVRLGAANHAAAAASLASNDLAQFYNIRIFGIAGLSEDVAGSGFYGDTLIRSILSRITAEAPSTPIGPGQIESGSDFTIDHLDASVRRSAYDLLQEVASYYAREWAIWEGGVLDWKTPNLQKPGWVIPISLLSGLDLDASVQNSWSKTAVLYIDAASQVEAEATASSSDRRNPYVLRGRLKERLITQNLAMTSSTAAQLASAILQDIGFGPVPAAGTISLPGEVLVPHASASPQKAWEIRAGDNVLLAELAQSDIFTQDGRGEVLFHVVSAESDTSSGLVTLQLDSYGSQRSDVLLARLTAVTQALGG